MISELAEISADSYLPQDSATTTAPTACQRGRQGKVLISVLGTEIFNGVQLYLHLRVRVPVRVASCKQPYLCICILHFNCKWKQLSKLVEILKRRIGLAVLFLWRGVAPKRIRQMRPQHGAQKTLRRWRCRIRMRMPMLAAKCVKHFWRKASLHIRKKGSHLSPLSAVSVSLNPHLLAREIVGWAAAEFRP